MEYPVDRINKAALELFESKSEIKLLPMLYDEKIHISPKFLFMGINPSFDSRGIAHLCNKPSLKPGHKFTNNEIETIYKNHSESSQHEAVIEIQRWTKLHGTYFKPFHKFTEESCQEGSQWEHIDLFFERNTKYWETIAIGNRTILSQFGYQQLNITQNLIQYIRPENLIIVNRLASTIFSIFFAKELKFCEKERCWKLYLWDGGCRVFYSCQWSSRWKKHFIQIKNDQDNIKFIVDRS